MIVEQLKCPRCGIQRTVRLGTWGRFCFNCRSRFGLSVAEWPQRMVRSETPDFEFSPGELLRLERYRAAVSAGFFTDWPALGKLFRSSGVLP